MVARLVGRCAGGVEVGLGLLGLLAGVLGGGERGLEPPGGALRGLLRAVELALAGAALGARLTQLGLELLPALALGGLRRCSRLALLALALRVLLRRAAGRRGFARGL